MKLIGTKSKLRVSWAIALAAILLTQYEVANACSCDQGNLGESYASSEVVFTAIVDDVKSQESDSEFVSVFVTVSEIFKGSIDFQNVTTSTTSCGVRFEKGAEYLIFATKDGVAWSCAGTQETRLTSGAVARGQEWVDALRSYSGGSGELTAPWYFRATDWGCLLTGELSVSTNLPSAVSYLYYRETDRRPSRFEELVSYAEMPAPSSAEEEGRLPRSPAVIAFGDHSIRLASDNSGGGKVRVTRERDEIIETVRELRDLVSGGRSIVLTDGAASGTVEISWAPESRRAIEDFLICVQGQ